MKFVFSFSVTNVLNTYVRTLLIFWPPKKRYEVNFSKKKRTQSVFTVLQKTQGENLKTSARHFQVSGRFFLAIQCQTLTNNFGSLEQPYLTRLALVDHYC